MDGTGCLEKGLVDGTGCLEKGLVDGKGCLEKVWWMARDGGESRRSETFPLALATTTIYYSALAFYLNCTCVTSSL